MSTAKISGVKGMNDILPQDAALWAFFEQTVHTMLRAYGYQNIRTPIVEYTRLFARSIGTATDIVEKEMYSFTDALNGEQLTLRPENTAAVVRATVEHNLLHDGPKRLWYIGPMFRHERPQRGRYRQFHQVGVEALGLAGPDADAEIILMCQRLWNNLGLAGIRLELNSLGQPEERASHREDLIIYLEKNRQNLDADAQRRLYSNPLRVLDTKNPALQEIVQNAPQLIDYLGEASLKHFEGLQALLIANHISYTLNPRLVRGLDYYNLTVFEWVTDKLGAQGALAAGGRYDLLTAQLGGKPAPACGWAIGIERVLELLRAGDLAPQAKGCEIYMAHQGETGRRQALIAAERLRAAGLNVIFHCSPDSKSSSLKAQIKRADASGAIYAVIIASNEAAQGTATVKYLRSQTHANHQVSVPFERLTDYLVDVILTEETRAFFS